MPASAAAEWHRHWPLVVATAVGMSLAALLPQINGVMLAPIEQEFGWSRAQISSGPAVVSIMGLFLATPAGYLIDRFGSLKCGLITIACTLGGALGMGANAGQMWQWWGAWALFAIAGAFTSTVWIAPVTAVFRAGRGLAIALTMAGTGLAMMLAPSASNYILEHYGWRSGFVVLTLVWSAVTLLLVLRFVPNIRPAVDLPKEDRPEAIQTAGLTPRQGFTSPTFYLLFAAALLTTVVAVALILNLVPVLTFTGLTRDDAVKIAGSMGVASIVGQLVGGLLMDRYSVRLLAFGASIVSIAFPAMLLLFPGSFWPAFTGVVAYGLTGGMKMNAITYLLGTHLGLRSFGLFYGAISITTTVAMGIGPLMANHIYDLTHSYWPVVWAAIPSFLGAGLLILALGPAPDFSRRA